VLEKEKLHVLGSDLGLPDEDGFDLIRQVRDGAAASGGSADCFR
jgi:DNA-binding response OmpR family regulator